MALGKEDNDLVNALCTIRGIPDDGIIREIVPGIHYLWMSLVAGIEQNNLQVFQALVPKYIKYRDTKPYRAPLTPIAMVRHNGSSSLIQSQVSYAEALNNYMKAYIELLKSNGTIRKLLE